MRRIQIAITASVLVGSLLAVTACKNTTATTSSKGAIWERELGAVANVPLSPTDAHEELNLKIDLIPEGKYGRRLFRELSPRYITIHSTQNPTGDAYAHAKALKRGSLRGGVCG